MSMRLVQPFIRAAGPLPVELSSVWGFDAADLDARIGHSDAMRLLQAAVDMTGVSPNLMDLKSAPTGFSSAIGVLDIATISLGMTSVTSNLALRDGSSQQGKARRASVASNWVVAR